MKVLFIVNKGFNEANLKRYVDKFKKYYAQDIKKKFGLKSLDIEVDFAKSEVDVRVKKFGENSQKQTFYGTENAKDAIRDSGMVPRGIYHAVYFCYQQPVVEKGAYVAPLTYWKGIYLETEWVEMPYLHEQNAFEHEMVHVMYKIIQRQGIKAVDQMDRTYWNGKWIPYYKNNNPLALMGNYYFSLSGLQPYLDKLDNLIKKVNTTPEPELPKVKVVRNETIENEYKVDMNIFKGGYFQTPNVFGGEFKEEPAIHIIHKTGGSWRGALNWLTSKKSKVSAHILYKRNGEAVLMAKETQRTWHSGILEYDKVFDKMSEQAKFITQKFGKNPNLYSLGHEFEAFKNETFTQGQYATFLKVIEYLQKKNNWEKGVEDLPETLMTHNEFVYYKPNLDNEKLVIVTRMRSIKQIKVLTLLVEAYKRLLELLRLKNRS